MIKRLSVLPLVLVVLISCGPTFLAVLNTARAVTAADAPVLNRLEQHGVITHTQNLAIDKFLKDTSANIGQTQTEWTAAGNDHVKQVAAVQASVNREAAAASGLVNLPLEAKNIIDDVNTVFAVIGAFYGATLPPSMRPAPGVPIVAKPMSEKDMEAQIKARVAALKQKLQ